MWVDDLAVPLLTNAGNLFASAGRAMAVAWNNFFDFRMECNMSAGKTAFLPKVSGKGSEAIRRTIADMEAQNPVIGARADKPVLLKIVSRYTHMGRCILASLSQLPELTARHASTRPYVDRLAFGYGVEL